MWEQYKIGKKELDRRFNYYRVDNGNGSVGYHRSVKLWWKLFFSIGRKLGFYYKWRGNVSSFCRKYLTFD